MGECSRLGDPTQFVAQLIAVGTAVVWGFIISLLAYKLIDLTIGLRVSPEAEVGGVDIPEMGQVAYPDFSRLDTLEVGSSAGD